MTTQYNLTHWKELAHFIHAMIAEYIKLMLITCSEIFHHVLPDFCHSLTNKNLVSRICAHTVYIYHILHVCHIAMASLILSSMLTKDGEDEFQWSLV